MAEGACVLTESVHEAQESTSERVQEVVGTPPDVQTHEGSQPRSALEEEHSSPEQRQPLRASQDEQMLAWWMEQSSAAVAAVPYEVDVAELSQVQTWKFKAVCQKHPWEQVVVEIARVLTLSTQIWS